MISFFPHYIEGRKKNDTHMTEISSRVFCYYFSLSLDKKHYIDDVLLTESSPIELSRRFILLLLLLLLLLATLDVIIER